MTWRDKRGLSEEPRQTQDAVPARAIPGPAVPPGPVPPTEVPAGETPLDPARAAAIPFRRRWTDVTAKKDGEDR